MSNARFALVHTETDTHIGVLELFKFLEDDQHIFKTEFDTKMISYYTESEREIVDFDNVLIFFTALKLNKTNKISWVLFVVGSGYDIHGKPEEVAYVIAELNFVSANKYAEVIQSIAERHESDINSSGNGIAVEMSMVDAETEELVSSWAVNVLSKQSQDL